MTGAPIPSQPPSHRRAFLAALAGAGAMVVGACSPTEPSAGGSTSPAGSVPPQGSPGASTPGASSPGASTGAGTPTADGSPTGDATPSPSATPCAEQLSLAQRAGQLLMMGVAVTGATDEQLRILKAIRAGSVIMMGNSTAGVDATRRITARIRAGADPARGTDLLVATDQEGGLVQRLRGPGFDDIPAARTQATWSTSELRSRAERWARQLTAAGVNSCLSPVADVVPPDIGRANKPIAANNRGYGDDAGEVSARITTVVKGLRTGGQATALKHFPGLGQVIGNTDFAAKVTDDRTTADDPLLAPFRAGIAAGSDMVMMSTAYYSKIDPEAPAAFSPVVVTDVLRGRLGWDGVVISDDLGVAKQVAYLTPGERAVAFLRAGGDLVINVDPATVEEMAEAILAEAKRDQAFAAELAVKAGRVLRMKAARNLAACRAR